MYATSTNSSITASITGSALSLFINNGFFSKPNNNNKGTLIYIVDLYPTEVLAITSITAY